MENYALALIKLATAIAICYKAAGRWSWVQITYGVAEVVALVTIYALVVR